MKTYQDLPLHTLIDKIFKAERERQIRAFTMTANDLCDRLIEVMFSLPKGKVRPKCLPLRVVPIQR